MELIDTYKVKRECTIGRNEFVGSVVSYIRDFRVEHWLETVKVKKEVICGTAVKYIHYEDGKTVKRSGAFFTISVVLNCSGDIRILFEDAHGENITVIPVVISDFGTAAEKLVKLIGDVAEDENGVHYPYIGAKFDIDVKAYDE